MASNSNALNDNKKSKVTKSHIKEPLSDRIFLIFVYTVLILFGIVTIYPLIYVLSASISDPSAVNSGDMWLYPVDITIEGYRIIFGNSDIWRGYLNTILYTVVGTITNLVFTLPAAYVLSRDDFQLKNFVTKMMVITMFVSGGMIPSYILITQLGLTDSMWSLILPGAASVYNIVVCRVFFQSSVPRELSEAAVMDGASDFMIFFKIVIPLSKPLIAVMALFYGVGHWNGFFNALLYIRTRSKYPLQMILREILVQQNMQSNPDATMTSELAEWIHTQSQLSAVMQYGVIVVSTLPIILVYPFLQKYFVQGVMIGSIKG